MCKLSCIAPITPRSAWVAIASEEAPSTLRCPMSPESSGERPIVVSMRPLSYPELDATIDRMLDVIQAGCYGGVF